MTSKLPSLGPRGEGWVVAQLLLGAAIVALGPFGPDWPEGAVGALLVTGLVIGAGGAALLGWGVASLGSSLTPYPRPQEGAMFRGDGVYRHVRHPIYGGVLLLALGWSLALSPLALAATALLWILLELKSRLEETMLIERYPEYRTYASRVRRRFVPALARRS